MPQQNPGAQTSRQDLATTTGDIKYRPRRTTTAGDDGASGDVSAAEGGDSDGGVVVIVSAGNAPPAFDWREESLPHRVTVA